MVPTIPAITRDVVMVDGVRVDTNDIGMALERRTRKLYFQTNPNFRPGGAPGRICNKAILYRDRQGAASPGNKGSRVQYRDREGAARTCRDQGTSGTGTDRCSIKLGCRYVSHPRQVGICDVRMAKDGAPQRSVGVHVIPGVLVIVTAGGSPALRGLYNPFGVWGGLGVVMTQGALGDPGLCYVALSGRMRGRALGRSRCAGYAGGP